MSRRLAFAGFRFPPEVILVAVRLYLRYTLSYRDLEELLAERGVEVDHTSAYRWVQRFAPQLVDAAGPCRHSAGDRWFVDETYVRVSGEWRYVYRAVDQYGQVIDVLVSATRDKAAARRFFASALRRAAAPVEVTTDKAKFYPAVIDEAAPQAFHDTKKYGNNRVEADHGRLKARTRPMRGLKTDPTAAVIVRAHAFIQNLRRGFYELAVDVRPKDRLVAAFGHGNLNPDRNSQVRIFIRCRESITQQRRRSQSRSRALARSGSKTAAPEPDPAHPTKTPHRDGGSLRLRLNVP